MELQPFPGGWDLPCAVLGARGRGWDAGSLHHLPAGCSQSGPQALTPSLAGFSGLSHSRPASGPRCREAPGSRGRWEHRGAWRPQPVPGTWCLWHPTVRTPPARRAREEASGSRKPLAGQHSSLLLGEAQQEAVLGQPGAPAAWTRGPAGSRPPWPLARSRGAAAGRQEQDVAPRQPLSMELNRECPTPRVAPGVGVGGRACSGGRGNQDGALQATPPGLPALPLWHLPASSSCGSFA